MLTSGTKNWIRYLSQWNYTEGRAEVNMSEASDPLPSLASSPPPKPSQLLHPQVRRAPCKGCGLNSLAVSCHTFSHMVPKFTNKKQERRETPWNLGGEQTHSECSFLTFYKDLPQDLWLGSLFCAKHRSRFTSSPNSNSSPSRSLTCLAHCDHPSLGLQKV